LSTPPPFSFSRDESLAQMARDEFDVCVIGAGINGAAIARDAALRGLKVALLEAGDFAGATSSPCASANACAVAPRRIWCVRFDSCFRFIRAAASIASP
jgi:choline dehydrogenase-like flavoprotein